jgi:hypothetical protein
LSFSSFDAKFSVSVVTLASVLATATAGCDVGASYFLRASCSFGGAGIGAYYCTGSAYFGDSSFWTNACWFF